jgi:hypothetical protein
MEVQIALGMCRLWRGTHATRMQVPVRELDDRGDGHGQHGDAGMKAYWNPQVPSAV